MTCVVAVVPGLLSTPPAGLDFTAYPVIELPPLDAGGVKVTVALALPAVAVTTEGAPGTVAGVMLLDGVEAGPIPIALVAVTVNV